MSSVQHGSIALLIGIAAVTAVMWVFAILKQALRVGLRSVPGPWYAAWTNVVLKWHVLSGRRLHYIHSMHEKYGRFVRISPNEVAISSLSAFKTIHRTGHGFNKASWYERLRDDGLVGLFNQVDPVKHAARRRLFAQAFSYSSVLKFEACIREKVNLTVDKIVRDATNGTEADVLKWFTFMATDVSGQLSFGRSFEMLQLEEKNSYIRDLETTMVFAGLNAELGFLIPIAKRLPFASIRHLLSLRERLHQYGLRAIANHREVVREHGSTEGTMFFSKFLDPTKNPELSDDELAVEASNQIVAGSDTTAITLTYCIWALLRPQNSRIKKKLLVELDSLPASAEVKDVSTLPYLKAVVDEALRLYGAAPGSLPRVVPNEGVTFDGFSLPAGTIVSTQGFTMHRDREIFDLPEEFLPERWDSPAKEMKEAICTFGAGSRICIGMHLALLEIMLGVFVFFKRCPSAMLAPSTTDESMKFENFFFIAPKSHRCIIRLEAY